MQVKFTTPLHIYLKMNSFEYSGFWWLPSNPEDQVVGNLKFSNKTGFSLELIGSFNNFNVASFYQEEKYPIILGIVNNKLITLYDCYQKNYQISFPGFTTQVLGVKLALIGHHFNIEEEIRFKKAEFDFTYLKDLSPLIHDFNVEDVADKVKPNYTIYTKRFAISNDIKASITKGDIYIKQCIYSENKKHIININKSVLIEVKLKQLSTIDEIFSEYISPLKNFITLISNQPNFIEKLYVSLDDSPTKIEIIFSTSNYIEKKSVNEFDFLLRLEDIEQDFSLIMQKWFNFYNDCHDIINLYFSTIYNSNLYAENEFLSLVQALESFHRRILDKSSFYTESHKLRLNAIIESAPIEYKDWLIDKLLFTHEPTLLDRLNETISLTKKTVDPLIIDVNNFVKHVKKIRNYLTHYNDPSEADLLRKHDIFRINQVLNFTIKTFLLVQLGCTAEFCQEKISRGNEYKYLKNLIEKKRNE
ncbi:HEPN domain-containing protein [Nostoc sp.]|uniref:ApeA N-terminal domain 1-containing protein n=1 Tax=Nostoc sp. TaxID=1180 RepID=UPI002FFCE9AD